MNDRSVVNDSRAEDVGNVCNERRAEHDGSSVEQRPF
jgi:hypothetical protein